MSEAILLFVYGTLRRGSGHEMGRWLAQEAEWRGPARCPGAALYRVSWYPALRPAAADRVVRGDLYRIDARLWPALDAFEGVTGAAQDEYEKRLSPVLMDDGRALSAWVYWYRGEPAGLAPVAGGDWLLEG